MKNIKYIKLVKLASFLNKDIHFSYVCVGNKKDTFKIASLIKQRDKSCHISEVLEQNFLSNFKNISFENSVVIYLLNRKEHYLTNINYKKFIEVSTFFPLIVYLEYKNLSWNIGIKNCFHNSLVRREKFGSIYNYLEKECMQRGIIKSYLAIQKARIFLKGRYANYKFNKRKIKILAIITLYNDCDIIQQNIKYLLDQGIDVHVIDNWSSDGSFEKVRYLKKMYKGVTLERFPKQGASKYYEWLKILRHIEKVANKSKHDWILHYDSDEFRESPWPTVNLYDGIRFVDSLDFNAIDFTVLNYRFTKTTNNFDENKNPLRYFKFCEFGDHPGHFVQVKAWKNNGQRVELAKSGGHDVYFSGRKVFPIKFLIKHYPLRSKKQANKKIFNERFPRFSPKELKMGFHSHYNQYRDSKMIEFDEKKLINTKSGNFKEDYMIELISGVGLKKSLS